MPSNSPRLMNKKRQWDSGSVWERNRHSELCCICSRPNPISHVELRPTGIALAIQPWPYCETCWQFHEQWFVRPRLDVADYQRRRQLDPHCIFARD